MSSPTETRPRWAPAPLIYASAALHAGAAVATLVSPPLWPWTLGAVALNHAALTGAGLWPKSRWLGPNWIRLPAAATARREVAITIDDGPDPEVTPRVLSLLGVYGARATFFCVGERVERHPELAREIVRLGHAVENHSQRHRHAFSLMGPGRIEREILEAQRSIAGVTGQSPGFFRAPAGLRNPFLDPVLSRHGLRLVTWTHRGFDTVTGDSDQVYGRLSRSLQAGDILLLHDGHAARGRLGTPVIVEVLPRLLETLRDRQLEPVTLRAAAA
ncbi:MAG TPA: polysaccharide deacetylase family protein [Steroidobacteraceae bacterium]|nr:polysaccharide deacetylase family protein [Steroidobacteraceae bacterium]